MREADKKQETPVVGERGNAQKQVTVAKEGNIWVLTWRIRPISVCNFSNNSASLPQELTSAP